MGFLDKTGFTYFVNKVIGKTSISGVGDGTLKGAISTLNTGKLSKTGDASNVTTSFSQASSRANIATGEKQSVLMGKIKKWFADMTAAAFAQIITSNTDLMANTVAGYLVDALAVKQQFDVVNSNLNSKINKSWNHQYIDDGSAGVAFGYKDWTEADIVVTFGGNPNYQYTFFVTRDMVKQSGVEHNFSNGYYISSTDYTAVSIKVTEVGCVLNTYNFSGTEYKTTSRLDVFLR